MGGSPDRLAFACRGRKITSLGVLYDFTGNSENTTVQTVAEMVKEHWVRVQLCPFPPCANC